MIKRFAFLMVLGFLIAGCSGNKFNEVKGLPEGYKLLCSEDGGKYSLILRASDGRGGNDYFFRYWSVFDSKKEAQEYAWYWDEEVADAPSSLLRESDNYKWKNCPINTEKAP